MNITDADLVVIYDTNKAKLTRLAYSYLKDSSLAEEAAHETFLRFIKNADKYADIDVDAWLFTVCRNVSIKVLRKNSKLTFNLDSGEIKPPEDYDKAPNPLDELSRKEENRDINSYLAEALETLSPNQRTVLRLRYYEDLTYTEIAEIMEVSEGNVGFMLHDAKRRLKPIYNSIYAGKKSNDRHISGRRTPARAADCVQPPLKRRPRST
jgi:RNA polymerase sigma-70 factor (ECF subfamily)